MTWRDEPMLAADTETTGTNPFTDRVVTACLGTSESLGHWSPQKWLINPGVAIPDDAARIHGITNEHARTHGQDPTEVLGEMHDALKLASDSGVPVIGHNLAYDLTLLGSEFSRHLDKCLPEGLMFLDTLVLFRRFDFTTGGRSLTTLGRRYGIEFPAHDAEADALASLRLLHVVAMLNDLLPLVSLPELQDRQKVWHAAFQRSESEKRVSKGQDPGDWPTDWPIRTRQLVTA